MMRHRTALLPMIAALSAAMLCKPVAAQTAASPAQEAGTNCITFEPFVWPSQPPEDIPFEPSRDLHEIRFWDDAATIT